MARFRYVGPGGGGHGRPANQAGVRLPGGYCLESATHGFRVLRGGHLHADDDPCANVRRGADLIEVPDDARWLLASFRQAHGIGGRVLYQEVP